MARFLRILGWTAGVLVALVVMAIGSVYFYVTSDDFRGRLEGHASTFSGRKTTIADIAIDWGWTPHVHLRGVQFANAEWAKEPHMFKVEQVDFEIRPWPLLKGDLVLPSLVMRKPEIVIEKGDNDRLNWALGEAPAAAAAAKEVEGEAEPRPTSGLDTTAVRDADEAHHQQQR